MSASQCSRSRLQCVVALLLAVGIGFALGATLASLAVAKKKDHRESVAKLAEGRTAPVQHQGADHAELPRQTVSYASLKSPKFRTATITRGEVIETVCATGVVEPEEIMDVAAKVSGPIVRFGDEPGAAGKTIDDGSHVEAGTVLAYIAPASYKVRVASAQAGLDRAEAELAQKRAAMKAAELREKAKRPGEDVAVAKAAVAVAEASLRQCKSALASAKSDLDATTIRSPISGVVIARRVGLGQNVGPDASMTSLFLVAKDLRKMQVWASVNEADIVRVRVGQKATFVVDNRPKETFEARVRLVRLDAQMVENVVTYPVILVVDNRDLKLLPYQTALVRFDVSRKKNVLRVSSDALRFSPRGHAMAADAKPGRLLWLLDKEQKRLRSIAVDTGVSDGELTEVGGPEVQEGMRVVLSMSSSPSDDTNPFVPVHRPKPLAR